ncbi:hypothetical protein Pst134EB_001248 [Puccinia striiformis f. sp. tritici]|nr:hypothetical protein Pst134EB_001248 [Puccinia striiformis f. sp. tritici]
MRSPTLLLSLSIVCRLATAYDCAPDVPQKVCTVGPHWPPGQRIVVGEVPDCETPGCCPKNTVKQQKPSVVLPCLDSKWA